ncbi:lymphoid specific helicase, putative [Pediculus humanus corporis]|uniref:Proliferation-associated SNF2-like protein n=1 Tax=Pediculus humanus subsp. corporis TaxID=121224 RepID=E0VSA2_PEDHC|nr:lymphoid specific helicase, putative [Pediculus humanus corporis]EEB16258.1 lymphoid specific helicase, putative [Pediculus humanus corporis]
MMSDSVNGDFYCDETSSCSNISASLDELPVNSKMIEEEAKLIAENEKIEQDMNFVNDSEGILSETCDFITEEDWLLAREQEIKERRYKQLLHLLNNSQTYSMILKDRLESEMKNNKVKAGRKKSNATNKKTNSLESCKLGDVISQESIDENTVSNETKPQVQIDEEDYFKETRVTRLGYTVSYKQPLLLEGGIMKDYQLKGCEWLKILFTNGVNGILADEMGMGKTIQVIAFICHMIEQDIKGPFLVVAPLSTVSNWMMEFKRFAPKVPTLLYHGNEEERKAMLPDILKTTLVMKKLIHPVVITSYNVPMRDTAVLGKINWYYLIIDEGHRIKNHNSLLSRILRKFNTVGRLLLTGTPLQNNLTELWSLLNFLLPEVFNTLEVFESWFDIKELESNGTKFMSEKFNIDVVSILQEILVPFLLRREKKDVNLKLPPKKEILIYCPMTPSQKKLYQGILDKSIEILIKPKENKNEITTLGKRKCFLQSPYGNKKSKYEEPVESKPTIEKGKAEEERFITNLVLQNPQMNLRKVVNHPFLIQYPLKEGTEELRIDEDLVKESGKMLVLDALLSKLKSRGHKVIIFSFFKVVLDILEDYVLLRDYQYSRLDGDLNIPKRNEEIQKFMDNPEIFVFLITMRSGGLGINLTAADTVIFYDSDWNPTINLQSQDRCHRIGQSKPVMIYRLCVKGTIDEKIIERANAKRRLEKMILQKGKFTLGSKNSKKLNLMDFKELKHLLESINHDITINANGFVLSDEELEALLDRSTVNVENSCENDDNKDVYSTDFHVIICCFVCDFLVIVLNFFYVE